MTVLPDIADLIYGYPFPASGFRLGPNSAGLPLVRIRDVVRGFSNTTFVGSYEPTYVIENGDMLIGMDGEFNLARWHGGRALLNQRVCKVVPRPGKVEPRYLFWVLPRELKLIEARTPFVTVKHLSAKALSAIDLSLPSLTEQRRIADILDKADAIRRKRKDTITLIEQLLRSAFLGMFGDPVTNPKGWPVKPLGEVIERLEAGWSANGEARQRTPREYGVLKVSAVTSGVFRADEHKAVKDSEIDRELVTPRRGDLLFSRANTRELVAATCLVERDEPRLFLPDKLWRVVPRARVASTPYLRFLLAHDRFRGELTNTATGTSGSMLNVSMEKLRSFRGPIPPYSTQQLFAEVVWKTLHAKSQYEAAEQETGNLFASLIDHALSGGGL